MISESKLRAAGYREPTGIQLTSAEANERARRLCSVRDCGQVVQRDPLCDDCDGETEAMRRYLRAREIYLRAMMERPTWRDRFGVWLANLWSKIWGGVVPLIATTFFTIGLCAAEIPAWVLPGILFQESSSRYIATGAIDYVNRTDGKDGEIGPFQMTPAAFDMIKKSGEEFARLKTDMAFAEDCCQRYLRLLYADFAQRDWFIAVGRWNAGPRGDYGRAWRYAKRVQRAGGGL